MRCSLQVLGLLLLLGINPAVQARDAYASWDNRCEECHGDADAFSQKYLWIVDDKLQGRHHIDNLALFLENHYIPSHEIEKMSAMMKAQANRMARFGDECGACHGQVEDFVRASISTWGDGLSGIQSEQPLTEFLPTHQEIGEADTEFFERLLTRVVEQIKARRVKHKKKKKPAPESG